MSNWKVGPGGRLYHPTTGAYVGQLDDNGNEVAVVPAEKKTRGKGIGKRAMELILEGKTNYPSMTARRRLTADHPIEKVGAQLRAMMPWIAKNKLVDQSKN